MNKELLQRIKTRFDTLATFTATNPVDNQAVLGDRRIINPGDTIQVIRWFCNNGPVEYLRNGKPGCCLWSWLLEAGAPAELAAYMPFAPKTWEEILAELP